MKLGVCVPYRNREAHMNEFVPHVSKFLEERGIEHTIYLAHQCDDALFNRGLMKILLLNMHSMMDVII